MPKLKDQEIIDHVSNMVMPTALQMGLDIVELKIGFHHSDVLIHILADRPTGGITLEECSSLNRAIVDALDQAAVLSADSFMVEVASPGLDRPLKTYKDFLRNLDYNIRLSLAEPVLGKKEIVGVLKKANEHELVISSKTSKEKEINIPLGIVQWGVVVI